MAVGAAEQLQAPDRRDLVADIGRQARHVQGGDVGEAVAVTRPILTARASAMRLLDARA